jgi:hypothetical protein
VNHTVSSAGGDEGAEVPSQAEVNSYLFSTLGPPPSLRVTTADRTWLVLVASSLIFVAGGLVLKLPWLRRREVLFVAVVLLAAASLAYPEPSLLLAQAASLGLLAVVAVLALKAAVSAYRPAVVRGSSIAASSKAASSKGASSKLPSSRPALNAGAPNKTASKTASSIALRGSSISDRALSERPAPERPAAGMGSSRTIVSQVGNGTPLAAEPAMAREPKSTPSTSTSSSRASAPAASQGGP